MKKLQFISMLLIAGFAFSCSSSSDDDDDVVTPPNNAITYSNTISGIMGSNCNSCHSSPPKNGAPMALGTLAQVKDAIQNKSLIGRIENGSMPPAGNLTPTQISNIKAWETAGFPQ